MIKMSFSTYFFNCSYFIKAMRQLYLKGAGLSEMFVPQMLPLLGLMLFFNGWAVQGYKKRGN